MKFEHQISQGTGCHPAQKNKVPKGQTLFEILKHFHSASNLFYSGTRHVEKVTKAPVVSTTKVLLLLRQTTPYSAISY